jgi:hypothetical protein
MCLLGKRVRALGLDPALVGPGLSSLDHPVALTVDGVWIRSVIELDGLKLSDLPWHVYFLCIFSGTFETPD